jgi:hypothetical protein
MLSHALNMQQADCNPASQEATIGPNTHVWGRCAVCTAVHAANAHMDKHTTVHALHVQGEANHYYYTQAMLHVCGREHRPQAHTST